MSTEFYDRPMVQRLVKIFGDPKPPSVVNQRQFDGADRHLVQTSKKAWHEIDRSDYWHYLMDLCYVDLQQDLFDYLFPAFLIRWWEGQLARTGGPSSECDFYRAVERGNIFEKMMGESRRRQIFDWMVDAYIEGVDQWSGSLSGIYNPNGPDNLHGPLSSFHAICQSVPIASPIMKRLRDISTEGRAQWWLVLATGIAWNENDCPYTPKWDPFKGGGGVYILQSAASIFDHGYLIENFDSVKENVTLPILLEATLKCTEILPRSEDRDWAADAHTLLFNHPEVYEKRLSTFLYYLGEPDLGGVMMTPLGELD